jgi:hypothetical protein
MNPTEREAAIITAMNAELRQLRFENKWLREANKGLSEALDKARKLQPDQYALPNNAGEGEV